MTFDKECGFSVIQNNGRDDTYSQKCMFISILDWFRINVDQPHPLKELTLQELFNIAGPFPGSSDMMWDIDCKDHLDYLLKICKILDIWIHIYYANTESDGQSICYWLGNQQPLNTDTSLDLDTHKNSHRIIPIVAWGMHFELIVSRTNTTQPFKIPQSLVHRVVHYRKSQTIAVVSSGMRKRKSVIGETFAGGRKSTYKRHKKNNILEKAFDENVKNISYYLDMIGSPGLDQKLHNNYILIVDLLIESTKIQTEQMENKR